MSNEIWMKSYTDEEIKNLTNTEAKIIFNDYISSSNQLKRFLEDKNNLMKRFLEEEGRDISDSFIVDENILSKESKYYEDLCWRCVKLGIKFRPHEEAKYIKFFLDPGYKLLSGNTFHIKDEIKSRGGKWNAETKQWIVKEEYYEELSGMI